MATVMPTPMRFALVDAPHRLLFFIGATNFADHNHSFSFRICQKHF